MRREQEGCTRGRRVGPFVFSLFYFCKKGRRLVGNGEDEFKRSYKSFIMVKF